MLAMAIALVSTGSREKTVLEWLKFSLNTAGTGTANWTALKLTATAARYSTREQISNELWCHLDTD